MLIEAIDRMEEGPLPLERECTATELPECALGVGTFHKKIPEWIRHFSRDVVLGGQEKVVLLVGKVL
jgi:hypothetical protein